MGSDIVLYPIRFHYMWGGGVMAVLDFLCVFYCFIYWYFVSQRGLVLFLNSLTLVKWAKIFLKI